MKKNILLLLFSLCSVITYAQDLKNPRLESSGGSSWSSGNYLLFIDPGTYIKKSDIEVSDLKHLLREWRDEKKKITEQERLLNEQKKEIDELKRIVTMQQKRLDEMEKKLDEQKRKIDNLERKVN